MLSLAEDLLLLAVSDDKGTIASGKSLFIKYGLPAALLIDLMLRGRIGLGPKDTVELVDDVPTGDDLLDDVIRVVGASPKQKNAKKWVRELGGLSREQEIRRRLLHRLMDKGILREEEGKVLWVFTSHRYPTQDGREETETRALLREVALSYRAADVYTIALLGLVRGCRLLDQVFAKDEKKRAENQVKDLVIGSASYPFIEAAARAAMEDASSAAVV